MCLYRCVHNAVCWMTHCVCMQTSPNDNSKSNILLSQWCTLKKMILLRSYHADSDYCLSQHRLSSKQVFCVINEYFFSSISNRSQVIYRIFQCLSIKPKNCILMEYCTNIIKLRVQLSCVFNSIDCQRMILEH